MFLRFFGLGVQGLEFRHSHCRGRASGTACLIASEPRVKEFACNRYDMIGIHKWPFDTAIQNPTASHCIGVQQARLPVTAEVPLLT